MRKRNLVVPLFLLAMVWFYPLAGNAQVLFSEIAWMGTDEDANNEWIELYNMSSGPLDLTGWTISDGDAFTITLSGTIAGPHGIGVIERTDDDTLPGSALMIYTGALTNSGATLTLRDQTNTVIDQTVGGTDWTGIVGSNTAPKMTPQRTRTGAWVTNTPTPGADNAQVNAEIASSSDTETASGGTTGSSASSRSRSGGSGTSSGKAVVKQGEESTELQVHIRAPKTAYVNQEVVFSAESQGPGKTILNSLNHTWNFGDTYAGKGRSVTHTYTYPGEYISAVEASYGKHIAGARHELTVLPVEVVLDRAPSGDILIRNNSKNEVELSGYTIVGARTLELPPMTFIKPGAILSVRRDRVENESMGSVALYDATKSLVTTVAPASVAVAVAPQKAPLAKKTIISPVTTEMPVEAGIPNNEASEATQEVIVQIGNSGVQDEAKEQGIFSRMFTKVFGWF